MSRGRNEDSIFWDRSRNRYIGEVSTGIGPDGKRGRRRVIARTKAEVREKLRELHDEMEAGVRSKATYTVEQCVEDWLATLSGKSQKTQKDYAGSAAHAVKHLGKAKLKDLTPMDVQKMLDKLAKQMSTRSVQLVRQNLMRAIRRAEFNSLVGRNVAALAVIPQGKPWTAL